MTEQEIIALFVLLGVLFTAVISLIVAVLGSRQKALEALARENRLELESLREQVRVADLRLAKLESRDRQWADYVHRLRRHITDQKPPPPPEWPAGLDR